MAISKPLLKQSIKANGVLWIAATLIVMLIIIILKIVMAVSAASTFTVDMELLSKYIIALWKDGLTIGGLTESLGLSPDFLENMQNLDMYLVMNNMFYNLAGALVPMLYCVIVANNLVASQVDRGSMSFILSTPIKRSTVIFTQTVYLVVSLLCMFIISAAADLITSVAIGLDYNVSVTVLLNFGLFLVMLAMSGISFMFASIFNLSKYSYAAGGGLGVIFYISKVLGMFGDPIYVNAGMGMAEMHVFDYFSIISLLDTESIYNMTSDFIWKFAILFIIGLATYIVGNVVFVKKDLPL